MNLSGQKATASVTFTDSGNVISVVVNASNADLKASVEQVVRSAAPYPMHSNPDVPLKVRLFTINFTVK